VTGKVGTDIQDNKCSWLIVQALQKVTEEQRLILEVITLCNKTCCMIIWLSVDKLWPEG
jgi:geranylgeranyl pyrophosphate synthase